MNISICGADGYIGQALTKHLLHDGHLVVPITKQMLSNQNELQRLVDSSDVIINLAGASIMRRWSESNKQEIIDSRIKTTNRLVEAINRSLRVKSFISTSAVGIYSSIGCHDESSKALNNGLLSKICQAWEAAARHVKPSVRLVIARLGVVLSEDGGAFEKMISPRRFGFVISAATQQRVLSWINMQDCVRAIEYTLKHRSINGIVNVTAPEPTTQWQLVKLARRHYRAPITISIPKFIIKWHLGDAAAVVLSGQCATPRKLLNNGFKFTTPNIETFIDSL